MRGQTWCAVAPAERPALCEDAAAWYTPLRPLAMTLLLPRFEPTGGMQCARELEVAWESMRCRCCAPSTCSLLLQCAPPPEARSLLVWLLLLLLAMCCCPCTRLCVNCTRLPRWAAKWSTVWLSSTTEGVAIGGSRMCAPSPPIKPDSRRSHSIPSFLPFSLALPGVPRLPHQNVQILEIIGDCNLDFRSS